MGVKRSARITMKERPGGLGFARHGDHLRGRRSQSRSGRATRRPWRSRIPCAHRTRRARRRRRSPPASRGRRPSRSMRLPGGNGSPRRRAVATFIPATAVVASRSPSAAPRPREAERDRVRPEHTLLAAIGRNVRILLGVAASPNHRNRSSLSRHLNEVAEPSDVVALDEPDQRDPGFARFSDRNLCRVRGGDLPERPVAADQPVRRLVADHPRLRDRFEPPCLDIVDVSGQVDYPMRVHPAFVGPARCSATIDAFSRRPPPARGSPSPGTRVSLVEWRDAARVTPIPSSPRDTRTSCGSSSPPTNQPERDLSTANCLQRIIGEHDVSSHPFWPDLIRRLDHVAVLVRSTEQALEYFSSRLELPVVASEERPELNVRLTYLSTGNAFLQLVEPLSESRPIAAQLAEHGEGIHHICFGSDDPVADASALGNGIAAPGGGRGRVSAFVPGPIVHGVRVECTGFDLYEDVENSPGALG